MIDKSEVKKAIFHSAGCEADDWLEGAHKNANAFEGAKQALRKAAKDVQGIVQFVQKDLDDGKFSGMEPADIAKYAILQVTRAVDSLQTTSLHYTNRQIAVQGEVAAYERLVNHFQKLHDEEDRKISRFNSAVESGEIIIDEDGIPEKMAGNGHVSGARPAGGIAAQRRAEAAAELMTTSNEASLEKESVVNDKPKEKRKKGKQASKKDKVTEDGKDT